MCLTGKAKPASLMDRIRRHVRELGIPCNPVGTDNIKIGGPATYRPIQGADSTCPSSCPMWKDGKSVCYGASGRPGHAEMRASADVRASLNSVAVALALAGKLHQVARLHVTGDFCRHDNLDLDYIQGVIQLADRARQVYRVRWVAFTYEHLSPERRLEFEPWRTRLREAGVVVRRSDHVGSLGALVLDHGKVDQFRKDEQVQVFKCPAQIVSGHAMTCQQCTLCWTSTQAVAFHPHGTYAKKVRDLYGA